MNNLKEREENFLKEVLSVEGYGLKMLDEFFDYWSEPGKKSKMRFEMEKTWDLKRRLKRWFDNQNKWNATRNNNSLSNGKGSYKQQTANAASRFLEKGKAAFNTAIREAGD